MSVNIIGKRIEELRNTRKMSQEELGSVIGVKRAAINKYERGTVTNIPKDKVEALADFFGVAPSYLYGWDDSVSVEEATNAFTSDPTRGNIRKTIAEYKKHFPQVDKEERYKWEAVGYYQRNWSIDAENFSQMFAEAFKDASNLLSANMYWPYKMVITFAEQEPEKVRELFKMLYDEEIPLAQRYVDFRAAFDEFYKPQKLNHYQDLHAISVYLSFEYPQKYYIYKYKVFKEFSGNVGYVTDRSRFQSEVYKLEAFFDMCELVLDEVKKDTELQKISSARLDDGCYKDSGLHLLTHDIVYFGSRNALADSAVSDDWWPSLDEYDPNLSKEDWKKYVLEIELPDHPSPMQMLKAMMELNGEASCKRLSQLYGGTVSAYVGYAFNLGKRVKKYFNLPACMDGDQERYFPNPFLGRSIIEDGAKNYCYKIRPELFDALQEIDLSHISARYEEDKEMSEITQKTDVNKNTILYGPPGTGKTYNTVVYAVAIVENKLLADVKNESYSDVLERYNTYRSEGLIEFTTFHQSYGYEEFIEGIKPVVVYDAKDGNADTIHYEVLPGVFKDFCRKAAPQTSSFDDVWNRLIDQALEAGGYVFTRRTGSKVQAELRDDNTFIVKWNGGTSNSLKKERIYEQWLANNFSAREKLSGGTKWAFDAMQAVIDTMVDKFGLQHNNIPSPKKNHVFIIDEINRGNISKIFGELITLIESSKRIGQPQGMKAKLPYSQQLFGVPDNVYIIGTMNTADRSIATIDTALRRRFRFKEMMPDADVLKGISVEDISVSEMLARMNKRISVLYDREHTIGHAYFIPLRDNHTIEQLAEIFENAIIPLLQEYFYEDYEKIRLVLGDNKKDNREEQFIVVVENDYNELFGSVDIGFDDSVTYEINRTAFDKIEAYRSI